MANLQVGVAGNGTVTVGAGASVHSPASNTLTLGSNNAERLRIDSSGRLLIGTTTEGHANGDELTISKDSGAMGMTLRSGDSSNCHLYFSDATSGDGEYAGYISYQHSDNSLQMGTNATERVRITSSVLGINVTPSRELHVKGLDAIVRVESTSATGRNVIEFFDSSAAKGSIGWPASGNDHFAIQQSENADMWFSTNDTERLRVRADGRVSMASSLAVAGICTAATFVPTDGQLSHRNLIINGAMNIAQRGTTSTTSGYGTVDRFKPGYDGHDEVLTQAQHALTSADTGPWAKGLRSSLHLTNGNQTSGAGAADYAYIYYYAEAQDLAHSGWDYTSTTAYITLSFWVRSSVAQTFYGYVKSQDGTQKLYSFSTGALSANTWKKVEVNIPGHADLQFDVNKDAGFQIAWIPFMGTDYTTSGHTASAWMTYSGSDRIPDNTSTWWTTNDSTFEITGVQLEVGSVATPFEHRSYGDEMARCQRYYFQSDNFKVSCAQGPVRGEAYSTTEMFAHVQYPQPMRAAPTWIVCDNSGNTGAVHKIGNPDVSGVSVDRYGATSGVRITKVSGWTAGDGYMFTYSVDAEL